MKRGQSIGEYCLFIGIIALSLAAIQVYARRGVQAVLKAAADKVGNHGDLNAMNETDDFLELWNPQRSRFETNSTVFSKERVSGGVYRSRRLSYQRTTGRSVELGAIVTDRTLDKR